MISTTDEPFAQGGQTTAPATGASVETERRRSRRRATPGVLVAIEAPSISRELCWAGSALDLNGDGLGVSLPPEVEAGNDVLLTFRLDEAEFSRVPAVVLRHDLLHGVGAVEFGSWSDPDRLSLLTYLLAR